MEWIKKLYFDIHKRLCEILDINVKPLKGVKIGDKSTCDGNFIYINKKKLEEKDEKKKVIKIVGILAHEDMHYINYVLFPIMKAFHDEFVGFYNNYGRSAKLIDVFDEFLAILVEYIIKILIFQKVGISNINFKRKIY